LPRGHSRSWICHTSSALEPSRSVTTNFAPCWANSFAADAPRPWPDPVMMATCMMHLVLSHPSDEAEEVSRCTCIFMSSAQIWNLGPGRCITFPSNIRPEAAVGVNSSSECCEDGRTCPRMALTRRCCTLSIFFSRSIIRTEDLLSLGLWIKFSKNTSKSGLFSLSFPFFASHGRACALSEICRDCPVMKTVLALPQGWSGVLGNLCKHKKKRKECLWH